MDDNMVAAMAGAMRGIFERSSAGYARHQTEMFGGFPAGTCGPVAELVARYLGEFHDLHAGYVAATRDKDNLTHAWVEVDGLVIDLTADQFGDAPPVMVTRQSGWHSQWDREPPRPPILPPGWPMYPHEMWQTLVEGMEALGFHKPAAPMEADAPAVT